MDNITLSNYRQFINSYEGFLRNIELNNGAINSVIYECTKLREARIQDIQVKARAELNDLILNPNLPKKLIEKNILHIYHLSKKLENTYNFHHVDIMPSVRCYFDMMVVFKKLVTLCTDLEIIKVIPESPHEKYKKALYKTNVKDTKQMLGLKKKLASCNTYEEKLILWLKNGYHLEQTTRFNLPDDFNSLNIDEQNDLIAKNPSEYTLNVLPKTKEEKITYNKVLFNSNINTGTYLDSTGYEKTIVVDEFESKLTKSFNPLKMVRIRLNEIKNLEIMNKYHPSLRELYKVGYREAIDGNDEPWYKLAGINNHNHKIYFINGYQMGVFEGYLENKLKELENETKYTPDEVAKNVKAGQAVMLFKELGLLEHIDKKYSLQGNQSRLAKIVVAITGHKQETIRKCINGLQNEDKNDPYKSEANRNWLTNIKNDLGIY